MHYDIAMVAKEIMIEPEDLQEILEIYIQDAGNILSQCEKEYAAQNAGALAKLFHALKGSSLNLRLNNIGSLAAQLEKETKEGQFANVDIFLQEIKKEILSLQELL